MFTAAQLQSYNDEGFVVRRSVFDASITRPLLDAVGSGTLSVTDTRGNRQELNVWTFCGDDLVGRLPRSEPMVEAAEQLIGESVYHWHSKISWKQPGTAGTWDWHQDYGFWAEEGCARPALTTVSIALDHQATDNGCMRVIPGSHRGGVLSHPRVGHGRAADPTLVDAFIAENGVIDLVLEPGDIVAFHCNTLHASGPNTSERSRTLLHTSYNAVTNGPTNPFMAGHEVYPLDRVPGNGLAPGEWTQVFGDTRFLPADEGGYGGRDGYQVN